MPQPDTKKRLLDAAEALFAERGIEGTSLREITSAADANLASVNYHFGGKAGLLEAIFGRRVAPVNEHRLRLLDGLESSAGPEGPTVEEVLWAFLAPPFEMMTEAGEGGHHFIRIIGRMHSDPKRWAEFFKRQFQPVTERFEAALQNALPELSTDEVWRRMHYLIGSMAHTFCWSAELCPAGPGMAADQPSPDVLLPSMVRFGAAGFRAGTGPLEIEGAAPATAAPGSEP